MNPAPLRKWSSASATFFHLNTYSHPHEDIGWRPVLELVA
jgi:hypothetical protein